MITQICTNVIIFHGQQLLSFLCYHFPLYIFCVVIYVIFFRVLSFMLSFNVIIYHGQQMLSFSLEHILCYHLCYHLMLSFIVIIFNFFLPARLKWTRQENQRAGKIKGRPRQENQRAKSHCQNNPRRMREDGE